jgi:hypothetical protein
MSLYRRNPKRDGNELEICRALEAMGFSVARVSGAGCPDLVVAKGAHFMRWVEIKQPKGTYTAAQTLWRSRWTGPPPITLRSIADAERFCLIAMESPRVPSSEPEA